MTIEQIAQVAHEANRAYCQTLGDASQPEWEDAPDWQRKSVVNGVKFHLLNPSAGPEHSHESWLAEKVADGWVYGPIKDSEKKQHPCIIPFSGLPLVQQAKDMLFLSVVNVLRLVAHPTTCPVRVVSEIGQKAGRST